MPSRNLEVVKMFLKIDECRTNIRDASSLLVFGITAACRRADAIQPLGKTTLADKNLFEGGDLTVEQAAGDRDQSEGTVSGDLRVREESGLSGRCGLNGLSRLSILSISSIMSIFFRLNRLRPGRNIIRRFRPAIYQACPSR